MKTARTGDRLGGFRIEELLGQGGAGAVYRATQLSLDRPVALKVLHEDLARDPSMRRRFLAEGRLAARLSHPHLVDILTAGEEGGRFFLAYELLSCATLRASLTERGQLPVAATLGIAKTCAQVLSYIHDAGIIHRDLKPENLFDHPDRGILLGDLGIARDTTPGRQRTAEGVLLGTPAYMAPEVIEGAPASGASDFYALGILLYECLTGEPPYFAGDPARVLRMHLTAAPRPLGLLRQDVPPALESAVHLLLNRDPARRPASTEELSSLLEGGQTLPAPRSWKGGARTVRMNLRPGGGGPTESTLAGTTPTPPEAHETRISASPLPGKGLSRAAWLACALAALGLLGGGWFLMDRGGTLPPRRPGPAAEDLLASDAGPSSAQEGGLGEVPSQTHAAQDDRLSDALEEILSMEARVQSSLFEQDGSARILSAEQALQRTLGTVLSAMMVLRRYVREPGSINLASTGSSPGFGTLLYETFRALRASRDLLHSFPPSIDGERGLMGAEKPFAQLTAEEMLRLEFDKEIALEVRRLLTDLEGLPRHARRGPEWRVGWIGLHSITGLTNWRETPEQLRIRVLEDAKAVCRRLAEGTQPWKRAYSILVQLSQAMENLGLGESGSAMVNRALIPATRGRDPRWLPEYMSVEALEALLAELEALQSREQTGRAPGGAREVLLRWTAFRDWLVLNERRAPLPLKPLADDAWLQNRHRADQVRIGELLPLVRRRVEALALRLGTAVPPEPKPESGRGTGR